MAMIECRECKGAISDQAASCPKCGAPVPKPRKAFGFGAWIMAVFFFGGVFALAYEKPRPKYDIASAPDSINVNGKTCDRTDLQCRGEMGTLMAARYCRDSVERLAPFQFRWVDSLGEFKFSHLRWTAASGGRITYIGDKIEFQNVNGAFSRMTYECDLEDDNRKVLDARVYPGRLG